MDNTPGEARRLVERANALNEHARETVSFGPERAAEWDKLFDAIDAHDAVFAALVQAAEAVLEWTRTPYGARLSVFAELRAALAAVKEGDSE